MWAPSPKPKPQTQTPNPNPRPVPLDVRACRCLWTNGVDNATRRMEGGTGCRVGRLLRSVLNGDAFFIAFCFACELNAFYWPKARPRCSQNKGVQLVVLGPGSLERMLAMRRLINAWQSGYIGFRTPTFLRFCSHLMDIMAVPIIRTSPRTMKRQPGITDRVRVLTEFSPPPPPLLPGSPTAPPATPPYVSVVIILGIFGIKLHGPWRHCLAAFSCHNLWRGCRNFAYSVRPSGAFGLCWPENGKCGALIVICVLNEAKGKTDG